MVTKFVKRGVIGLAVVGLAGTFFLGGDMLSYVSSSAKSVRTAVKDSVPIEFELARARDMLENIQPEMYANIRIIAKEEVEVAALKADIEESEKALTEEESQVSKLRQTLETQFASYQIGHRKYTRQDLTEDLTRRFERVTQADMVLEGKRRLLATREQSLQAAMQLLERTKSQRKLLAVKIEGLEGKYRLIQAAATGSHVEVDSSKLAQADKLLREIKKRLDVAERVLAHESRFVQPIEFDNPVISEIDLFEQIDNYFSPARSSIAQITENTDHDEKR
jgi:hypothetical protein